MMAGEIANKRFAGAGELKIGTFEQRVEGQPRAFFPGFAATRCSVPGLVFWMGLK